MFWMFPNIQSDDIRGTIIFKPKEKLYNIINKNVYELLNNNSYLK